MINMINANGNEITTTVAFSTSLTPSTVDNIPRGSVIYFWESHTKNLEDEENIQAASNLLHRINLLEYEKYEIHTGYLSRWNYMPKDIDQLSTEEIKEAIRRGYEEQDIWLKRCNPDLPGFVSKDWQDCISEKQNPYYEQCKELLKRELEKNKNFYDAFLKSINSYTERHGTNFKNGEQYILEETSWIFSLPLLHLNKYIFLVHVGKDNPAIKEMFKIFPNLNEAVKWVSPRLRTFTFQNEADLLMYYNVNINVGCSYPMLKSKSIMKNFKFIQDIDLKESSLHLESGTNIETVMIHHIIENFPAHIYWLNHKNIYFGCNETQAKDFGLKSKGEIIGKTNFDFHEYNVANKLNKINELIMSTGEPYEGEEPALVSGRHEIYLSKKIPISNTYGKCIGMLGISFDITEKKKIEEVKNKLTMKEELYKIVKEVSHDIASPVSSLKIIDELYEGKLLDEDKRMLKAAITSIEKMAGKMLSKYRLNERIERGEEIEIEEKKEEEYVNVDESLWNIVEEMRYRNKGRKVDVEIKYGNEKGNKILFVRGDGIDFERMISNIINNGIEAVEGKKAEIEVRYEEKGEEVEIRIKDNGEGMPKKMAEKLLKGEEIGTTKKDGYGIGTQQIMGTIKAMKGKLEIESKEGEWTEFILRFRKMPLMEELNS